MKSILTNNHILIHIRRRALECYNEPIFMYGFEFWTISKQVQKKLEATDMWFLQRMLQISWTVKKSNKTVLQEADTRRSLINRIHKHQATFFGHVKRREKPEYLLTIEMIEEKQQEKTVWKDLGWTNKVAQSSKSDRSSESNEG